MARIAGIVPLCDSLALALTDLSLKIGLMRILIHPDTNKEKLKERLSVYGMTIDRYFSLLEKQNWVCAICRKPVDAYVIDHDHSSGIVRGLLCHPCNVGLGNFQDSVEIVSRAVAYLKSKRTPGDIAASFSTRRLIRRLHRKYPAAVRVSVLPKRESSKGLSEAIAFGWATVNGEELNITPAGTKIVQAGI